MPPPRTRPSRAPGRAGLHRLKFSHAVEVCQAGPASPRNLGRLVPARSDPAEPTFPGWVSAGSGQVRSGQVRGAGQPRRRARPGPWGPGSVGRRVARRNTSRLARASGGAGWRPGTRRAFPLCSLLTRSPPTRHSAGSRPTLGLGCCRRSPWVSAPGAKHTERHPGA